MRRKNLLPLLTATIIAASLLGGCGNETTETTETATEQNAYAGKTISGEVTEVTDSSVTIKTDDTDEELTVDVTDETSITGQVMSMPDNNSDNSTPPELPDGEAPNGEAPSGEAPSGEAPSGEAPNVAFPSNAAHELTISDISVGDSIEITFDDNGDVTSISITASDNMGSAPSGGMGQPGGSGNSTVESYDAVNEYNSDTEIDGENYSSTGTDENAIHITDGATVSLKNITVSRVSSESNGGDNSSFYGVGAAILNTDGTAYISDSTIDTDADGAAGVFAYGDGVVYVSDTDISTTGNTAGGIHVAGGGTLYASNLNVETQGASSAAIRSDRGGGKMVVDGGSYTSNGTGSPAVYSTADIAINDAALTANGSEAVCIEGLNSLRLFDTDLTGNMSDDEQNDCTWNVILYQSMSGDSEVGNSTFEMVGGSLTANNGGMFYTTNTESTFILNDVDITYADDNEFFLRCTGNDNQRGWGSSGSNGADCSFTAISQDMKGDIIWDSISTLDFYMTDGSTLVGAVTDDESYAGNGGDGYCNLYIEKDSTWTVTGDSTLSALYCSGTIKDSSGNTVTIKGADGTVYVSGTSKYTITVDEYSTSVDISNASECSSWSDYEVDMTK